MKQILTTLLVLLFTFQNLYSGTIKIPSDQPTIQVGIVSSSNGDTILVSPGTYYENINFNGKNIVLGSLFLTTGDTSYISQTIIDGSQQGCVVVFESGEDSTAALTGFTITNGYSYLDSLRGGGITCINSSNPKLINLNIKNNKVIGSYKSYGGGGIYCLRQSSPIIENILIKENRVEQGGSGGGVLCRDSSNINMINLVVTGNYNSGNNDSGGGGIAIINSRSIFVNLQIRKNQSRGLGGGVFVENSTVEIHNTSIKDNFVYSSYTTKGGGIYTRNSNVSINDSEISGNSADAYFEPSGEGGGIFVLSSSLQIENCLIKQNRANGSGGGITTDGSNTTIITTSIKNNSNYWKNSQGGGICSGSLYSQLKDTLYLVDVIIEDNHTDGYGGGICYYPKEKIDAFKNVTIKNNRAGQKGGGLATNQNLLISASTESSIFLNKAKEKGTDIYIQIDDPNTLYEIYLDTVTVSAPNDYQIYPIENTNLQYGYALYQTTDSDLYVSVDGSNVNSGISPSVPLKTIGRALLIADADSLHLRTINAASGFYSPTTNGEEFPLYGRSYVTLSGEDVSTTILDGEKKSRLIEYNGIKHTTYKNMTIQNGIAFELVNKYEVVYGSGGGIAGRGNEIIFRNFVVRNNRAKISGGGFYLIGNVELNKVQIYNNILDTAYNYGGAGLSMSRGNGKIINSTIVNNIIDADSTVSGGLSIGSLINVSLVNSIIWNNSPRNISLPPRMSSPLPDLPSSLSIAYSNLQDGEDGIYNIDTMEINWLKGNIDKDPLFVGGNPFDYNLSDSSPCINAGTPFYVWEGDTLINLSPSEYIGEAPDMGALESDVLISVEGEETVPTEFNLYQNYPNPFGEAIPSGNPSTTIKYSIAKFPLLGGDGRPARTVGGGGLVTIKVYDILGREVTTLVNKVQKPGNYEVKFNASELASGLYFYRITTNGFTQTKKMILIK